MIALTMAVRSGRRARGEGIGRAAVVALALLAVAQAADYVTFLLMVGEHGLVAELNPIVAALAAEGLGLLTIAKASLVVFVGSSFLVTRPVRPRVARGTLAVGIIVGAIGAGSNLLAL